MHNETSLPTMDSLLSSAMHLEKSIVATLLDSQALIRQITDIIEPTDFFNPSARVLYTWIRDEQAANREVDTVLAMSTFSGQSSVEGYLYDALSNLPTPSALRRQAEELRALSLRRSSIGELQKVIGSISRGEAPLEQQMATLTKHIQHANQRLTSNVHAVNSYEKVGQIWKDKFKRRVAGDVSYHPTGYDDLDNLILGLEPQDFIIIGARPSMGKTTFAMNIAENMAMESKKGVLVFSLEMPADSLYQRSLSSVGGVDFEDLRSGRLQVGDVEKIEVAMDRLDEAPIFIDDTPSLSLAQLSARAHKKCQEESIHLIVIDYLQLMQVSKHTLGNRNEGIGEISRGLKQLARDLNIPVVALSQLSRDLEKRPNKRPINSDLRDSGSIEQDADVILFVYRDEVYNEDTPYKGIVEIIIGKQRNGPLGDAKLSFAKGQSRFMCLNEEQRSRLAMVEGQPQAEGKKGAGAKGSFTPRGFTRKPAPNSFESSGQSFADTADPNSPSLLPEPPEYCEQAYAQAMDSLA